MMRAKQYVVWAAGGLLCLLCAWPPPSEARPRRSLAQRLLGPIASPAASMEWVRFDWHWRRGEVEDAYLAAERALWLDPGASEGWIALALHLAQDRASAARGESSRERLAWVEEGLAVLERGVAWTNEPAQLHFVRGLLLAQIARSPQGGAESLDWPGGPEAAYGAARGAFDRARAAGHVGAQEQIQGLERELEQRSERP